MKRIIVITGASSGMGVEFARQLAARPGVDELWLIARREERLQTLASSLQGGAPLIRVFPGDVGGRNGGLFVAKLLSEAGGAEKIAVDTLVNCAGFGVYGPFTLAALDKQLEMIEVNAAGLTAICGAALPYLVPGSRIVNVASLASFAPMGNFAVYAASKAYVLNFTLGLAAELADKNVRVTALCPGPVDTEFSLVASGGAREKVLHGENPAAVVEHCLACLERGKPIAVMTAKWKLKAFLPRLAGRLFTARFTMRHESRPAAPVFRQ
jgi:short-subunit dehydrogenase